jgi:hypothetical protein
MNNTPPQLTIDLAALLGFAAGNRTKAAAVIEQAKQALGIDKLTRSLNADDKAAIVQWHKARLTDENQIDIETIAPPVALNELPAPVINEPIETAAIIEQVETIPPAAVDNIADEPAPLSELELLRLENEKLKERLETIDHKAAPTYHILETVRIAFYIGNKRTVIALSGFYSNALMVATGIDKKSIPAWIQSAVNEWTAFDAKLNVTEQVKLLIVRELENQLIKARG